MVGGGEEEDDVENEAGVVGDVADVVGARQSSAVAPGHRVTEHVISSHVRPRRRFESSKVLSTDDQLPSPSFKGLLSLSVRLRRNSNRKDHYGQ